MPETTATKFGEVLRAWFSRNEWPQMVAEQVARAKGSKIGPWASQMSNAMQGKLEPKPPFFVALGWFNQVVMERDFVGITDRRLIDRLLNGQPLTHDDGQPFTAVDFFALYIGDLASPTEIEAPKPQELTQEIVDAWVSGLRDCFRDVVLASMQPPATVWREIAEGLVSKGLSKEDIEWTQELVIGLRDGTIEEAKRMQTKYPGDHLSNALVELEERYKGVPNNTTKLRNFVQGIPKPVAGDKFLPTL